MRVATMRLLAEGMTRVGEQCGGCAAGGGGRRAAARRCHGGVPVLTRSSQRAMGHSPIWQKILSASSVFDSYSGLSIDRLTSLPRSSLLAPANTKNPDTLECSLSYDANFELDDDGMEESFADEWFILVHQNFPCKVAVIARNWRRGGCSLRIRFL